ncbi:hypothetical protein MSAN_00860300 [Mycena sanguinolenta]|uniref:Uncharacterized protein n=1 Tax=Mycena sanguinolenta TaxID=230812 RepID=A0A8H6Z055_9AGAR|nr:hypothetical protein MSAN_00860300 [Mycena sanguinolenta]
MTTTTGIVGVTTSGIQDISAFLPLLGTAQCEEHVSSALERGFFYAAGAPISIFGSLGIVKAGLTTLWISLDTSWFHGPRQMRNAGFHPRGVIGKLAYKWDRDDSIYVAEAEISTNLHSYKELGTELNLSRPWLWWNLQMLLFSIGFGSLGLLPYFYIIRFELGDRSFFQSWLYPVLRIAGSVIATTMIQLIVQLRISVIVFSRLQFQKLSSLFGDKNCLLPVFWDVDTRSEECLSRLRLYVARLAELQRRSQELDPESASKRFYEMHQTVYDKVIELQKSGHLEIGASWWPSLLLALCRLLLLGGITTATVGYIGCFSLIQASNNSVKGPGIWLGVELVLCLLRLVFWASNPGFDDPPGPFRLDGNEITQHLVGYGIGWMFRKGDSDVVVDNLHAVVIGLGSRPNLDPPFRITLAARSLVAYLERLPIPKGNITSIIHHTVTSAAIRHTLESLSTDDRIPSGAPIVIYLSGYLDASDPQLRFVTADYHPDSLWTGLACADLLELLSEISSSKGDNITVILDMFLLEGGNSATAQAVMAEFLGNDRSSYVLLAYCSPVRAMGMEELTSEFLRDLERHIGCGLGLSRGGDV